jgi:hypothetical protein
MIASVWESVRASIYNYCNLFADDMRNEAACDLQIYNWDDYVEQQKIPEADLIGPWNVSAEFEGRLVTVRGHIGISIYRDPNLFKLEQVSGALWENLVPGTQIPIYHAVSGGKMGTMTVTDGTSMSPVAEAQQRKLKFISFTMKTDQAV